MREKDSVILDVMQHEYSLCVIQDNFSEKERYLVYYDSRWDCKFFPNYKTNAGDNETYLVKCISNDLGLNEKIYLVNILLPKFKQNFRKVITKIEFTITDCIRLPSHPCQRNIKKMILW